MNSRFTELALRKQRLQFRAAEQRSQLVIGMRRIEAALDVVDRTQDRLRWLRERTPVFAAAVVVLAIAKPRAALRLARRVWLGWAIYRRLEPRFAPLAAAVARFRAPVAKA